MPVCVGLWRSFLDYKNTLLTIFASLSLILHKTLLWLHCLSKIIPQNTAFCFAQMQLAFIQIL